MSLLTSQEVRQAIETKAIAIEPLKEDNLKAASYDVRLGKRGIIAKSLSMDELKVRVDRHDIPELDIEMEKSINVPGGGFALVSSLERIAMDGYHVGHIGMKTYYVRKGLMLLSGLQIDPWWDGFLILGLANLSPRTITLDFGDDLCTIEVHKLNVETPQNTPSIYMAEQREGRIPRSDKDYLRTIETMSVSDLTQALLTLSGNVENLGGQIRYFWIGFATVILVTLLTVVLGIIQLFK